MLAATTYLKMAYILPMLLGRTFDARTNRVGIDIFPEETLNDVRINEMPNFESHHKTVTKRKDAVNFLSVSGDLSLLIKMGGVDVKGVGDYLKESTGNKNSVEVLYRAKYITETVSLKDSPKPFSDWEHHNPLDLGTHYVSTISYGGMLLATVRFTADKRQDIQQIEILVNSALQNRKLEDASVTGELEKIHQQFNDSVKMEINYYATVPLMNVPHTIPGLQKLVASFKDDVNSLENKRGVPIEVELTDLSNLRNARKPFTRNLNLVEPIEEMEKRFDDLRTARTTLVEWVRKKTVALTADQEKKIADVLEDLHSVLRVFYETLNSFDVTKGARQLKKSEEAYYKDRIPVRTNVYSTMVKNFISTMDKEISDDKNPLPGSISYTHWGRKECNESIADTIYEGVAVGTRLIGIGGAADFLCMGRDVDTSGHERKRDRFLSTLGGLSYAGHILGGKGVICAKCNSPAHGAVNTQIGAKRCPVDWHAAYTGTLMVAPTGDYAGEYLCVDEKAEGYDVTPDPKDQTLIEALVEVTGFPGVEVDSLVPCTVCIR